MIKVQDIKVSHRTRHSTSLQSWQTYWFKINNENTFGIEKQDGLFKFYSKHCKTLNEAKQYIVEQLNNEISIYNL